MALDFRESISNPNALDAGNVKVQERVSSKTIKLSLFTTNDNAVWAATQQLRKESYPFATISITVNRDLFRLQVGDCFKFSYALYGISNMICRVLQIEEKSLDSEDIIVHAVEDFYSTTNSITVYKKPIPIPPASPTYDLIPFYNQSVFEAPYLLESDIAVVPIASRSTSYDLGMHVHLSIDGGNSYFLIGSAANIKPHGVLYNNYPASTYTIDDTVGFSITFSTNDVNLIETITWSTTLAGLTNNALLGNELITFQTITPVSGMVYKLEGIIRGRLDTEKVDHTYGEDFYWIGPFNITCFKHQEVVTGADRKFKLVPYNMKKTGDLSEAAVLDLAIVGRTRKPYVPVNFIGNGSGLFGRYAAGSGDVVLEWSPRYRGKGAGIGMPGEVLADTDREGLFEIEVWIHNIFDDYILVRTITDIDDTTWTYTEAMQIADYNWFGLLSNRAKFKLLNYRTESGFTYKSNQVEVVCLKN